MCSLSSKDPEKLKECEDCKLVRYCGDKCKDEDQPKHKTLCEKRKIDLGQLKFLQKAHESLQKICGDYEESTGDEVSAENQNSISEFHDKLEAKSKDIENEYVELLTRLRKETQKLAEEKEDLKASAALYLLHSSLSVVRAPEIPNWNNETRVRYSKKPKAIFIPF